MQSGRAGGPNSPLCFRKHTFPTLSSGEGSSRKSQHRTLSHPCHHPSQSNSTHTPTEHQGLWFYLGVGGSGRSPREFRDSTRQASLSLSSQGDAGGSIPQNRLGTGLVGSNWQPRGEWGQRSLLFSSEESRMTPSHLVCESWRQVLSCLPKSGQEVREGHL